MVKINYGKIVGKDGTYKYVGHNVDPALVVKIDLATMTVIKPKPAKKAKPVYVLPAQFKNHRLVCIPSLKCFFEYCRRYEGGGFSWLFYEEDRAKLGYEK